MLTIRDDEFRPNLHPEYYKSLGLNARELQAFLFFESLRKTFPNSMVLATLLTRFDKNYFVDHGE